MANIHFLIWRYDHGGMFLPVSFNLPISIFLPNHQMKRKQNKLKPNKNKFILQTFYSFSHKNLFSYVRIHFWFSSHLFPEASHSIVACYISLGSQKWNYNLFQLVVEINIRSGLFVFYLFFMQNKFLQENTSKIIQFHFPVIVVLLFSKLLKFSFNLSATSSSTLAEFPWILTLNNLNYLLNPSQLSINFL